MFWSTLVILWLGGFIHPSSPFLYSAYGYILLFYRLHTHTHTHTYTQHAHTKMCAVCGLFLCGCSLICSLCKEIVSISDCQYFRLSVFQTVSNFRMSVFQTVSISECQYFRLSVFQTVSISECQYFRMSVFQTVSISDNNVQWKDVELDRFFHPFISNQSTRYSMSWCAGCLGV